MYLVSVQENESMVEASLGGRITAEEMQVFGDELHHMIEELGGKPFNLLIDYSKARTLDREAVQVLSAIKDGCLGQGANKIVSVPRDEHELVRHTSTRLQAVLEGREEFISVQATAHFPALPKTARKAA